jgi:hypothetical protein
MPIQMPLEPTYYYECSYGTFRLIYHIPFAKLEKLLSEGNILKDALEDYPDGADINCTPAEYEVFEKIYQYKPPVEPEKLRRAFYALFSSLDLGSSWEDFKGSGYIKASRLENISAGVDESLKPVDDKFVEKLTLPDDHSFADQRRVRIEQVAQQTEVDHTLQEIKLDLVTKEFPSDLPLTRQSLIPDMDEGDPPEEIFSRAQKQSRK